MPTQQRPSRALTESLADQFHLIRQLTFQKLFLASQFLFARYFLWLAREVVPLYWHCLVVVAFNASFHQLDQVPGVLLSLFFLQIPNFGVYCRWQINYFLGFRRVGIFPSSLFLDKLFLIFHLEHLLLGFRQEWLGFLFCVSYRFLFIWTIFWL
ncbi:Hypothetical_protein [Hexamita inflata]|uniref:Hypothetical_protein n=1 Tax=Hexamita inflata TaxID=28002 RepID=A0AA86Q2G9_9EUKA|nr:Hypothetical protein HINF_LOCUS32965 [Hexamita inflata]